MKKNYRKIVQWSFKVFEMIIVFLLLFSNSSIVIAEEIAQELENQEETKAIIDVNLTKYNRYNIHDTKGTIVQLNVKTGIEYKEEQKDRIINKTTTLVKIPEINGQLPERVSVIAKSNKVTNGQESNLYANDTYDKEKGILQIVAVNESNPQYNGYDKDARDQYEVICIYSENNNTEEQKNIKVIAAVIEELNEGNIYKNIQKDFEINENIGTVISSDIWTQKIYNGYIKANQNYDTNYETIYKEKEEITISNKLGNKIEIKQEHNYLNEKGEEVKEEAIQYRKTKIDINNLKDILGEDGNIRIQKEDGTVIKEINKETEETEPGKVEIVYEKGTSNIVIQTSNPEKEGIIEIEHTKAIPSKMKNTNVNQIQIIQQITAIKEEMVETEEKTEQKTQEKREEIAKEEKIIPIQEAQTQIDITMNQTTLTNEIQNNVVLTVTLRADSNQYNLFKNPTIQINLPKEIEKVILGDVSLLYGEKIELKNTEVIEDKEGNKTIKIQLDGEQNSYLIDSINRGTNIVVPATIILKKEIETTKTKISTSYTNQIKEGNRNKTEEKDCEDIEIGIINANKSNEKVEENKTENTLVENEKTEKSQPVLGINQQESGLTLEAYAQIGNKKLQNGDNIHDTEIIKYEIKIKNTTQHTIKNVDISCQIPENTVYATINRGTYYEENYEYITDESTKEYNFKAEAIEPGETKTGFYEVVVQKLEDDIQKKNISNTISTKINNVEDKKVVLENQIISAELNVFLKSYIGRDEENSFFYYLDVTNETEETMRNINITTSDLQKEMSVRKAYFFLDDSEGDKTFGTVQNNKLQGVIPELLPGQTRTILIEMDVSNFDDNVNEVLLSLSAEAQINENEIYHTNENRRTAYPEYVTIRMSLDKEGEEVRYGEEVTYTLEIKNESKIRTTAHIYDYLPEEVNGISLAYENYEITDGKWGVTEYDIEAEANISYTTETVKRDLQIKAVGKPDIDEDIQIPAGKTVIMTIKAKTHYMLKNTEVSNYATAERTEEKENQGIKTVTSNIVKFMLVSSYEENNDNQNPDDNNGQNPDIGNEQSQTISGLVWEDSNKDGKRDNSEALINNVTVKLYNVETRMLEKKGNGESYEITTDEQGRYSFSGLKNGQYWVLFEYNSSQYSLTEYQKSSVSTQLNSDAISKEVNIDGTVKKVGMTDTLVVNNNEHTNIDMGLVKNGVFDLKLDKYISKIQVNTSNGTKQYSYENTQFAKIEIKAKEINNSNISIEYKIRITNEGDVEGFASRIVDYIPEGYMLNSSLSKGWTQDDKGNLVNTTLSSEFINPGESRELTVVLTKELTEKDTGTIINTAEIGESRNSSNIQDRDSVANNKNKEEDDYSETELLISIETGIITYTIIIIIIIGVLVLIILCIKGKIKPFKNRKIKNVLKTFVFITTVGIVLLGSNLNSYGNDKTGYNIIMDWERTFRK